MSDCDAEALRTAEEEFAKVCEQLTSAGFSGSVAPDPTAEARAIQRSFASVERMRAAERDVRRDPALRPGPDRPRIGRRLALAGLAAVAAAAVVTVAAPWNATSAAAATPPLLVFSQVSVTSSLDVAPAARDLLLTLADRAMAQPPQAASADGYTVTTSAWNLATVVDAPSSRAAVVPFQSVVRVAADGSAKRVEQRGEPLTPDGRGAAAGVEDLLGPEVQTDSFPPGFVDTALVDRLPREPTALRTALLDLYGCPQVAASAQAQAGSYGVSCLVGALAGLYREQLVPPDLAAALWQVLAAETALYDLGTGRDRAGRSCVAVGLEVAVDGAAGDPDRVERWLVLADPSTGAYLGLERVLVAGSAEGLDAPGVLEFSTLLSAE